MHSQQPSMDSSLQTHASSLSNLHALDNSHFLTVGIGPSLGGQEEATPPAGHVTPSHDAVLPEGLAMPTTQGTQAQATGQEMIDSITSDVARLAVNGESLPVVSEQQSGCYITLWQFNRPPRNLKTIANLGDVVCSSFHHYAHTGNMFLAVGMRDGTVKIFNIPNFSMASELHFSEMKGKDCVHIALNLSREAPLINQAYFRNPFRDLILTSVWSDGKVMVCQVARQ